RYPQNNHGLSTLSLSVGSGEFLLVNGPSGCGKSTLARCITGLIPHLYHGTLEGQVWLDGLCNADTPLWQLAEHAGMVFQNPSAQMLASSVAEEIIFGLENLGLPRDEVGIRLDAILERFSLSRMRDKIPQWLSGGEQQKVALAAIMARRPAVLVLDEPLSMLDVTAATELVTHLRELSRAGTSVIVCEHRAEYLADFSELRHVELHGQAVEVDPDTCLPPVDLGLNQFELVVEDLSVNLGGRDVLHQLNLQAKGGTLLAIVGRNGVGKTTLLRALAGLQAHEGRVRVNGDTPDLGIVFQNADLQLFNASVRDEVLYRVADPDMSWYDYLLDALGLRRYEDVPPLLLSEGEKKRLALATILMRRPKHGVLLDEPSLGQDIVHKTVLVRLARRLVEAGQLVIITTHDLELAAQADRILLLGRDGWVADGPPAQVMRDSAAWEQIGLYVPHWVEVPGG
ncbi:MAG: ATP-binding cassette domain-containing protein, partial [Anaerolineae bacterium]|nr:ATP-binding cassette domain-containing protein [Anaerolineae bacterium]